MRKIPPLNALKAFEAVARLGGVQNASEELHVTHGAVSRQIKQLESYLDIALFDRKFRALGLTRAGDAYFKSISSAFDLLHEGTSNLYNLKYSNALGIATTHSIATKWLMDKLPEFTSLHPDIEVWLSLEQGLTNFKNANINLSLRMGKGPWPGLQCIPLINDRLIVVCSPQLIDQDRSINCPEDILPYTLLHDQDSSTKWELWFNQYGLETFDSTKGPRYNSSDVLMSAAISGQGIALVSNTLAKQDIDEKRLIQPLQESIDLGTYFWLVKPETESSNENVNHFVKWIQKFTT